VKLRLSFILFQRSESDYRTLRSTMLQGQGRVPLGTNEVGAARLERLRKPFVKCCPACHGSKRFGPSV